MPLVRRLVRWLPFVALLALVLWQARTLAAWWSHDLTPTTQVGPFAVRDWARIGKVIQCVAAFVVVLDIIGAKRIQAEAEQLGQWPEALRTTTGRGLEVHQVVALRSHMRASLYVLTTFEEGPGPWWYEVARSGPPQSVDGRIGQAELDAWHADATRAIEAPHRCDTRHDTTPNACDWQIVTADEHVDAWLDRSSLRDGLLPGETFESIGAHITADYRRTAVTIGVVGGLAYLVAVLTLPPVPRVWVAFPLLGVVGPTVMYIFLATVNGLPRSRFGTAPVRLYWWILAVPAAGTLQRLAGFLGRYREGQTVKLFALALFMLGWLLDTMAA